MLAQKMHKADSKVMRYMLLGVIFLGVPYFLLTKFVTPALESLQQMYSNIDQIAQKAVDQPYKSSHKLLLDN